MLLSSQGFFGRYLGRYLLCEPDRFLGRLRRRLHCRASGRTALVQSSVGRQDNECAWCAARARGRRLTPSGRHLLRRKPPLATSALQWPLLRAILCRRRARRCGRRRWCSHPGWRCPQYVGGCPQKTLLLARCWPSSRVHCVPACAGPLGLSKRQDRALAGPVVPLPHLAVRQTQPYTYAHKDR